MNSIKNRINWIDITKFLGIYAIYIGHITNGENLSIIGFVFTYHVALFFFISGCTDNFSKETNFLKYTWGKIKSIYFPFLFFAVLSLLVKMFPASYSWSNAASLFWPVLYGCVREMYFAYQLWFLAALVLMQVLFFVVRSLLNKWLSLILCIVVDIALLLGFLQINPYTPFNVYWVLRFIFFYALGYAVFPYLKDFLSLKTDRSKKIYYITFALSLIFAVIVFLNKDPLSQPESSFTIWMSMHASTLLTLLPEIRTLILIWLNLCLARLCERITLFSRLGKETLWICGNEYIVKTIMQLILTALAVRGFVLPFNINSGIGLLIYVFVLLLISAFLLTPIERFVYYLPLKIKNSVLK